MSDNESLVIPEDEPFKNDKLNRKPIADNLTMLLKNRNNSFVLSIDSGWGTGKTTFIEMWSQQINNQGEMIPIYFNAWENDDFDDPLLAIISKLIESEEKKSEGNEIVNEVKKYAIPILKSTLLNLVEKATLGCITKYALDEIHESGKSGPDIFDKFNEYKTIKSELIKVLEKFQEEQGKKIVFFIDELDRCRPSFAIETLERIKHFFPIPGYIFVLSVDREQLSHSIATLYGQNMDSQGYLRRFIDLEFRLPEPDRSKYFELYKDEIRIKDYKHMNNFWRMLNNLTNSLKLSLRDINKLFLYLNLWIPTSSLLKNSDDIEKHIIASIASFLIAMKIKDEKAYRSIHFKNVEKLEDVKEINGYKINFKEIEGEDDEPQNKVFIDIITQFYIMYRIGYQNLSNDEFKFKISGNNIRANFLLSNSEFSIFKELEFINQF